MNFQSIEIHGERFIILSEREFLAMQGKTAAASGPDSQRAGSRFREVVPIKLEGVPASEILIQDRE